MTILYLKIQDNTELLTQFFSHLSDGRRLKTEKLKYKRDKMLSIGAEVLLHLGLYRKGLFIKKLDIAKNKFGKPYLQNHQNIHFNISHSGNLVVCGIASCDIGIDVEKKEKIQYETIIESFSILEKNYVLSSDEFSSERFLKLWTLKESYLKCKGVGLSEFLNCVNFDFIADINRSNVIFRNYFHNHYYFSQKELENYILSICLKRRQPFEIYQAKKQDIKELIAYMERA